jgi:hypothetical protein
MKKLLFLILAIALIASISSFSVMAEEAEEGTEPHEHVFNEDVWVSDGEQHWHECSCGEKSGVEAHSSENNTATCTEKDRCDICDAEIGETLPHAYIFMVEEEKHVKVDYTCTTDAEYYYSCACGATGTESYVADGTAAHRFTVVLTDEAHFASAATCSSAARYYYSCLLCGEMSEETFEYGEKLAHNFGEDNKCVDCGEELEVKKEYNAPKPQNIWEGIAILFKGIFEILTIAFKFFKLV